MIKISDYVGPVIDWRLKFSLPVRNNWEEFTEDELELAVKLIREELEEYDVASNDDDEVEMVDALVDLIFVSTQLLNVVGCNLDIAHYSSNPLIMVTGYKLLDDYQSNPDNVVKLASDAIDLVCDCYDMLGTFGNPDEFINEVYDSNMSKLCNTEGEAIESVNKYSEQGIDTYYKLIDGKYFIYRKSDDKVLKGINFRQPNLKPLITK